MPLNQMSLTKPLDPFHLAQELKKIVSNACDTSSGWWRRGEVTAHELCEIYVQAAALLLAEREKAIAYEYRAMPEEIES